MKEIAALIVGLFKDLKLPLRWLAVIASLFVIVLALFGYEYLTGHFYFNRLQKKIALLKELQLITNEGIDTNDELVLIYQSAVDELAQYKVRPIALPYLPLVSLGDPVTWGKAISGALVWLLVLIVGVSSEVGKAGRLTGTTIGIAIVLILIVALFAWLGAIIPTILNPLINYIGFPVIQFAIIYLLTRKKKPSTQQ